MTLAEFCSRYELTAETAEALLRKMKLPVNTPIDSELENILINMSDTRVPTYSPTRRSALSPSELEVLLKHYELHVETNVFFQKDFYAFGKMLFDLLRKTGRTLPIPADMIIELNNRLATDPENKSLISLKALLVQLVRSGHGIVSSIKTEPDLSYAEAVFNSSPDKNIAILSQDSMLPNSVLKKANKNNRYAVLFYLDERGLMRVNQNIDRSNTNVQPVEKRSVPADAPAAAVSPLMAGAKEVLQQDNKAASGTAYEGESALFHGAPKPFKPMTKTSQGERTVPSIQQSQIPVHNEIYPAYPAQDITQLTPGAVPHPFPVSNVKQAVQPMYAEPVISQNQTPEYVIPSQPEPPIIQTMPVPIEQPIPAMPVSMPEPMTAPISEPMPMPEPIPTTMVEPAPVYDVDMQMNQAIPDQVNTIAELEQPLTAQNIEVDEQGRRIKRGRLLKRDPAAVQQPPIQDTPPAVVQEQSKQSILVDNSTDDMKSVKQTDQRQHIMRENFVQGTEEADEPMVNNQSDDNSTRKLTIALRALYVALAVLGLGIIGVLIYQFLI